MLVSSGSHERARGQKEVSVMAVGIMFAPARVCVLGLCLLGGLLQVLVQGEVFRMPHASSLFLRSKRANAYLIEEILQGNLERECYEELCTYEEAREFFEDTKHTEAFWARYHDGNQCEPNPCLHGGNCTDKREAFNCSCVAPFSGKTCELGARKPLPAASQSSRPGSPASDGLQCPTDGPTACQQVCTAFYRTFKCSCMPGFKLQSDKRSCLPEVEFPCGSLPVTSNGSASMCPHGNCPWQVSVVTSRGLELCGGVLLAPSAVLTAANCLHQLDDVQPRNLFVVPGNEKQYIPVASVNLHDRFRSGDPDYDLPTKDFCEKVLMHSGTKGITKRRGAGQTQELGYLTLDQCRGQLNVSHRLSNKMFCMRNKEAATGPDVLFDSFSKMEAGNSSKVQIAEAKPRRCTHLPPGTPVATVEQGTAYLTGLVKSPSSDCDARLVFTKISRYLSWIKMKLEKLRNDITPSPY
ncbi:unnamed protein product [Tetraodon nigroviridis]|uniref:(spotted green pufferfish) hypothetical protein n=1 Tax=Tetraodon nigroviridis TaxID=99883 RepID=Q4SUA3_TETNG|nr:unnamed protein product [Tetraodon nigroviridis]